MIPKETGEVVVNDVLTDFGSIKNATSPTT